MPDLSRLVLPDVIMHKMSTQTVQCCKGDEMERISWLPVHVKSQKNCHSTLTIFIGFSILFLFIESIQYLLYVHKVLFYLSSYQVPFGLFEYLYAQPVPLYLLDTAVFLSTSLSSTFFAFQVPVYLFSTHFKMSVVQILSAF